MARRDAAARGRGASILLAVLLTGLTSLGVAVAPPASAHAALVATDPADGARLVISPAQVSATFNEPLQTAFAAMTVVGPDNNLWSIGDPHIAGPVISVGVRPLGPVGQYTVNYRVTSEDGHAVTGSWRFELTASSTGTPGPPAAPPAHEGGISMSRLLTLGGGAVAIVLVVIVAVWGVRRATRR
jgi:methionine-rich copper-binding protein CopC